MLSFVNDYSEGCHEKILEKLVEVNREIVSGYGEDKYCVSAKEKIRKAIDCETADIFFLYGGTQTNQVAIDCFLEPYEAVVAATTGHVSLHEAGAIEFSGHKVIELPGKEGKLEADVVDKYLKGFFEDDNKDHMIFPGMVYISQPTEYGTLYSLDELTDISAVCEKYNVKLYVDGARLGYGLAAKANDVSMADLARLTDGFYIGGTKVGALCGEALVYPKGAPKHMITRIKQHGALAAKGRTFGISFDVLFTDDLYVEISKHAIECADKLREAFKKKGYKLYMENPTNQVFIELTYGKLEELSKEIAFCFWEKLDDERCVVRCATSWATRVEDVDKLISII